MDVLVFLAIPFPDIDPVLFRLGPFAIHWYAIAYLVGLLGGWWYIHRLNRYPPAALSKIEIDDLLVWIMFGVVLGGRLGYVLFYNPVYYLYHPVEILFLQRGGMSFHGGLLGVSLAMIWFARRRKINVFLISDFVAAAIPVGLFFGRIANFVNGELYGRTSDVPWAVIFPEGGPVPRHPSQLYEAGLEGFLLFFVMLYLVRFTRVREMPGFLSGLFLMWYGLARIFVEFFRQPDEQLGFLFGGATMGQLLSLPVFLIGLWMVLHARRSKRFTGREFPPDKKEPAKGKRA